MYPLGIQIDGFQKLFQGLHPLSSAHFELKKGEILVLYLQNRWVPEPTVLKLTGSQEPNGTYANGGTATDVFFVLLNN